jgi:transcriptional regulator with XRE-family HTH domain
MRHPSRSQRGLGIAVRFTRERKKLTQETMAEQAGIAVPTLSHLEAGHANPTWATESDVASAIGISGREFGEPCRKHE